METISKKIIIKTILILFISIAISFILEYLFFYLSNTYFLNYYQTFLQNFLIEPFYFASIVTIYTIINQSIFKINKSKILYLLLFGSYFLLQVILQAIGLAFIVIVPVILFMFFYIIYKDFILKKKIVKSCFFSFLIIIIANIIYNIFKTDYGHFFFASLYSFLGIFHFFYIIFNLKELSKIKEIK